MPTYSATVVSLFTSRPAVYARSDSTKIPTFLSFESGSNFRLLQFPAEGVESVPSAFVSKTGKPLISRLAPTVSSASDVSTTGYPGCPMICTEPPIRSRISSASPDAVSPASGLSSFTTRLD